MPWIIDYEIVVEQRPGSLQETTQATLDGAPLEVEDREIHIPIHRDGAVHQVAVVLGEDVGPSYSASTPPLERITSV